MSRGKLGTLLQLERWNAGKMGFGQRPRRGYCNIGAMIYRKRCEDIKIDIPPFLTIIPQFQYSMDEVKTLIFCKALNFT